MYTTYLTHFCGMFRGTPKLLLLLIAVLSPPPSFGSSLNEPMIREVLIIGSDAAAALLTGSGTWILSLIHI